MTDDYVRFTKEMKKDYKILIPNMLPVHFRIIARVLQRLGYDAEMLENEDESVPRTGLKYVHNDTCYPAILVIGQFISALQSGKYDPHRTALILLQTGGGCRASNYIPLLRKALKNAGYGYVPVISLSLVGLEKHSGFRITLNLLRQLIYSAFCGDLIMSMHNQCRSTEKAKGASDKLMMEWTKRVADSMSRSRTVSYRTIKKLYVGIVKDFASLPRTDRKPLRVGIVGEIYVKFSSLGNNGLERFLVDEGIEVSVPGFIDFCFYCIYNGIIDRRLYGESRVPAFVIKAAFGFFKRKQNDLIKAITENSDFEAPTPIDRVISRAQDVIGLGVKMGEGWLLPAEMLELYDSGVKNIICTQPFGCLPNHICGKGMMRPIKDLYPDINIVAIDYDAGATRVNQINRIKLMLSNADSEEEQRVYETV